MRIGGYPGGGSTRGAGLPPRPLLRELPCQMYPTSEDSSIDVSESTSLAAKTLLSIVITDVEFRCAALRLSRPTESLLGALERCSQGANPALSASRVVFT